jgi:hypothetical protein
MRLTKIQRKYKKRVLIMAKDLQRGLIKRQDLDRMIDRVVRHGWSFIPYNDDYKWSPYDPTFLLFYPIEIKICLDPGWMDRVRSWNKQRVFTIKQSIFYEYI